MCRQTFEQILTLNIPVNCSFESWVILLNEHYSCLFNFFPIMKEYVADLNEVWRKLIEFMVKSQAIKRKYIGILGIKCLKLNKYEDEGRILKQGPSYAIIKKKDGRTKVVMGCYLPCMSIRLVISPNDDSDIGQDNEYADEAVGYMNQQLEVCWRVFPRLINKAQIDIMYVRKFKNVTCYLLLTGVHECGICDRHYIPMKEQLGSLKPCNFNDSLLNGIRAVFPLFDLVKLITPKKYLEFDCCKRKEQNNNSDESEEEGNDQPEEQQDDDDDSDDPGNSEEE